MHYTDAKTILTPQNGLNVYRGGPNNCIYSPLRNVSSHVTDFDDVEVKRNADALLAGVLRKKRNKSMIHMGTLADPYVDEERDTELTRKCLFEIKRYDFGVSIKTKKSLVLRDIDILCEINKNTKCVITIPFPTTDSELASLMDPDASAVSERRKVLEAFSLKKIPVIVAIEPIVPLVNDTVEGLISTLSIAAGFGAFAIEYGDMKLTLGNGSKEYFYKCIRERFPSVAPKYKENKSVKTEELVSPNAKELLKVADDFCMKRDLMHEPEDIALFRRSYENKQRGEQLSIFDY